MEKLFVWAYATERSGRMLPSARSIRPLTTRTTMPRPKTGARRIRLLAAVALLGASWNAAADESLLWGPAGAGPDDTVAGVRPGVQLAAADADATAAPTDEMIAPKWK